jgi:Uncharacterized conserved protein (COG2071)
LLTTWEAEPEQIKAHLPVGFEPIAAGRSAIVAVACFRNRLARLGVLPVPPYGEIDLRTFVVDRDGAPAVFLLDFFVPAVGLAAAPFGVPVKVARIRVSAGSVSAPSIGVAARCSIGKPVALGEHEAALSAKSAAYWLNNGRLRRMLGGYHGIVWKQATLDPAAHFAPVARLGLDPGRPGRALYADRAELRAALPARRT